MSAVPILGFFRRRGGWITVATALGLALLALAVLPLGGHPPSDGPTVGEKLSALAGERGALQARADGEARIVLAPAFRLASLLTDALDLRSTDRQVPFSSLPTGRRRAFADLDALNGALDEAITHPGKGARLAARAVSRQAQDALDRFAGDGFPLVLQASPRFVAPRPTGGELVLAPPVVAALPGRDAPRFDAVPGTSSATTDDVPLVPRYAPTFATQPTYDPPVAIEIAATGFDDADRPPVLAIGAWKGTPQVSPLRLRLSVPRSVFTSGALRTRLVMAELSIVRHGRIATFHLPFVVLPDQAGSFAFDQKVRTFSPEANTLVSPEILVRAAAGQTRSLRRCFDPPPGQHFDKSQRRIVTVERLGWQGDQSDPALNEGTMEFASDEKPEQICVVVTAKPANADARTATIGRFEATLVHEQAQDRAVKSGVRALEWNREVRVPIAPDLAEGKLYVQLLGDIEREYDRLPLDKAPPVTLPFLRISRDGATLVLRADPGAEP